MPGSYADSIAAWRANREQQLKSPTGWLTVAGLFWLNPGENPAGADPAFPVHLPTGRAPLRIGVFDLKDSIVTFKVASRAPVRLNNGPVVSASLQPDRDLLQIGDFTMFVIKRGNRYAIRLKDINSPMRQGFTTLHWYPVDEAARITATFTPEPAKLPIPNILGETELEPCPGYATFKYKGETQRLYPVTEGNQLFFIFRDQTSGKSTYGAGRFLDADPPKNNEVILDFNKAYNPPCAFTPYATCPLPPKQNRLKIRIEAGERNYGGH